MATPTKPRTALQGRFLWYELHTSDVKGATAFYEKVMNWSSKPSDLVSDFVYNIASAGDAQVGGLMELQPNLKAANVPPHWMGYVGCDDVDETIARAKKLGAQVHFGPEDIPNVGRFAVLADPQGAAIALLTPAYDPGPDTEPRLGNVSWNELYTTDYKAAWRFYSELFGWEEMQQMDMGEMGIYFMFGRGGRMLGGMMNIVPSMPMPPSWCYYVSVKDTKATAEVAKTNGATIINGPMEVPGGDLIAQGIDPQGAMFAIHSRKAS
jgi:predicted enzyme related to lactoylglutathione lyase